MDAVYNEGVMRTKCDDCQFVLVKQHDFCDILNQSKENTRSYYDNQTSRLLMVTEYRPIKTASGVDKMGEIVLRGEPDKLIERLLVSDDALNSTLDPTYIQDFLLTYRVFVNASSSSNNNNNNNNNNNKSPALYVAERLLHWFHTSPPMRTKIYRIVLEWISNHFNDFETSLELFEFAERFQDALAAEQMLVQLRVLTIALSTKAHERQLTLARSSRDEPLAFQIAGGWDKNYGIFVSRVDHARIGSALAATTPTSSSSSTYGSAVSAATADSPLGMRKADQIVSVNGKSFEHISLAEAYDMLRSFTHAAIVLKYNPMAFNEMLLNPGRSPHRHSSASQAHAAAAAVAAATAAAAGPASQLSALLMQHQPSLVASAFGLNHNAQQQQQHSSSTYTESANMSPPLARSVQGGGGGDNLSMSSTSSTSTHNHQQQQQQHKVKSIAHLPPTSTPPRASSKGDAHHHKAAATSSSSTSTSVGSFKSDGSHLRKMFNLIVKASSGGRHHNSAKDNVSIGGGASVSSASSSANSMMAFESTAAHGQQPLVVDPSLPTVRAPLATRSPSPSLSAYHHHHHQQTADLQSNHTINNHTSTSNNNFSNMLYGQNSIYGGGGGEASAVSSFQWAGEHVLKIYKNDQTFKYLVVQKETSCKEVVMLALSEFNISDQKGSAAYALCEVSVDHEQLIKQRLLHDLMNNLAEKLPLNARYYLRSHMAPEQFLQDASAVDELMRDSQINFLQLDPLEVAAQLTLRDYCLFRAIETSEYVDYLYKSKRASAYGFANLARFAELTNEEMFWVINEILRESTLPKRTRIIKHFIQIAQVCKECKNYNSLFAILSGLDHLSVTRLKETWDRVSAKYKKILHDLKLLLDPSFNMLKYRQMVKSELIQPPIVSRKFFLAIYIINSLFKTNNNNNNNNNKQIPFFPIAQKDLYCINEFGETTIEGLVNFDKLRKLSKCVRSIVQMTASPFVSVTSINHLFQQQQKV